MSSYYYLCLVSFVYTFRKKHNYYIFGVKLNLILECKEYYAEVCLYYNQSYRRVVFVDRVGHNVQTDMHHHLQTDNAHTHKHTCTRLLFSLGAEDLFLLHHHSVYVLILTPSSQVTFSVFDHHQHNTKNYINKMSTRLSVWKVFYQN